MKKRSLHSILSASMVLFVASLACTGLAPAVASTDTPLPPTSTQPALTATATARPSATPKPTQTSIPTPAPLGSTVSYGPLDIKLLAVVHRPTMHIGDISGRHYIYYYAPAGKWIIDLAALVHNTDSGSVPPLKWKNVYIAEANGDAWYPMWAKMQVTSSENLGDPFSIGISSEDVNGEDPVQFTSYTYLRLVYIVAADPGQTILFGISGSPNIGFQVTK